MIRKPQSRQEKNDFRDFVLLQLGNMPGLKCRAMFSGHGLWASGTFFGILYHGKLFFRTGPETLSRYLDAGMGPFNPSPDLISKNYYEAPPDVLASGAMLKEWAELAVEEALKVKKKPKRPRRRKAT